MIAATLGAASAFGGEAIFIEQSALQSPVASSRPAVVGKSEPSPNALIRPHFIVRGDKVVIALRSYTESGQLDSAGFHMITIEMPRIVSSREFSLGDPEIRVRYSGGSSMWSVYGLGYAASSGVGRLYVRRSEGDELFVGLTARFLSTPALREMAVDRKFETACSAKGYAGRKSLEEIGPRFGKPVEETESIEATHPKAGNPEGRIELECSTSVARVKDPRKIPSAGER